MSRKADRKKKNASIRYVKKQIRRIRCSQGIKQPKRWRQYSKQYQERLRFENSVLLMAESIKKVSMTTQDINELANIFQKRR